MNDKDQDQQDWLRILHGESVPEANAETRNDLESGNGNLGNDNSGINSSAYGLSNN